MKHAFSRFLALCTLVLLRPFICVGDHTEQIIPGILLLCRTDITTLTNGRTSVEVDTGTGFFVCTSNYTFLVTADHVAKMLRPIDCVVVGPETPAPQVRTLNSIIPADRGCWFISHSEADVAVAPLIGSSPLVRALVASRYFTPDNFCTGSNVPDFETTVTAFGFQGSVYPTFPNSPIVKDSKVASKLRTMARFDNGKPCQFFLLQDAVIGGMSGGPVWDLVKPKIGSDIVLRAEAESPKCYGMVHGVISDKTGGKLAAITPSRYIVEAINQAEAWVKAH